MIDSETQRKLNEMKFGEFVEAINILNSHPENYDLSFDEKIVQLVDYVYQEKYNQKVKGLKKRAKLRYTKADARDINCIERNIPRETIDSLANCDYITGNYNIVLHGPCGSGKTFVACALGNEAIKQGYKTFYIRLPELLEKYNELKSMGKTLVYIVKKYSSYDLLILDEWMMYPLSDTDKQFITELMEVRYDKSSTIFCSQYKPEDWYSRLGESTLTEALIDRIVHNMINLYMGTKNFRDI